MTPGRTYPDMADVTPGETRTFARTFSVDEVRAFAELSKDEGYHHMVTDDSGEVVVHGLLTATLPTKIGGDLDFVARDMTFEFLRPVYTGERIECEVTVTDVTESDDRTHLTSEAVCTNEDDEVVLRGEFDGVTFG